MKRIVLLVSMLFMVMQMSVASAADFWLKDESLGGVKLLMKTKQVIKQLGEPGKITQYSIDNPGWKTMMYSGLNVDLEEMCVECTGDDGVVLYIKSVSPEYKTAKGLAVGQKKAAIIKAMGEPDRVTIDKTRFIGHENYIYEANSMAGTLLFEINAKGIIQSISLYSGMG